MNKSTIKYLSNINKNFYKVVTQFWNKHHDYVWDGLIKLKGDFTSFANKSNSLSVKQNIEINVLDLGAGHCRFITYLESFLNCKINYVAVDFVFLYPTPVVKEGNTITTIIHDFLEHDDLVNKLVHSTKNVISDTKFDIIVAFGVLHHIPSLKLQENFFKDVNLLIKNRGLFCFTTWQFKDVKRLQKNILTDFTLPENRIPSKILQDLDKGDYFVHGGQKTASFRYSHYYEKEDVVHLLKYLPNLNLTKTFLSDGKYNNVNMYYLLEK